MQFIIPLENDYLLQFGFLRHPNDNYLMYLYTLYLYIDSPVSLYFEGNNEWIFVPGLEQDYNKVTSQVA